MGTTFKAAASISTNLVTDVEAMSPDERCGREEVLQVGSKAEKYEKDLNLARPLGSTADRVCGKQRLRGTGAEERRRIKGLYQVSCCFAFIHDPWIECNTACR